MPSMREVAELFKEKGISFSPRTFDAYLKGMDNIVSDEELKNA